MLETIKIKSEWDSLLKEVECYDFYHTYDYHSITKKSTEEFILLKYTEGNKIIAIPLILSTIPDTSYKDATSVYGYCGPITKNIEDDFDNTKFTKELYIFFKKANIISVFSRLHPYYKNQSNILKGIGKIESHGNIVNIDLTLDLETQKKQYHKRLKTYINKARKKCKTRIANTENDIQDFIKIYYENMVRVNAEKKYYFDKKYFMKLLNSADYKSELLLVDCLTTGEVIGGAIFIKKNNVVQYHLSGAKEQYLSLNPIKLLIDEMRIISTLEGYKYFNLGGGLGGSDLDSLFHFKSSFSKDFKNFKLWKYIVHEKIYKDLMLLKKGKECSQLNIDCLNFFPCYRCNHISVPKEIT